MDILSIRQDYPILAQQTLLRPAHLIDITQIPDEKIKQHKIIGLLEWAQKHIRSKDLSKEINNLVELINKIVNVEFALKPNDNLLLYIETNLYYILSIAKIEKSEKFIHELNKIPQVGDLMLGTVARKWIEEGKAEGFIMGEARGEARGKTEGLMQAKIETARAMLLKGFNLQLVSELTNLSIEQITQLNKSLNVI